MTCSLNLSSRTTNYLQSLLQNLWLNLFFLVISSTNPKFAELDCLSDGKVVYLSKKHHLMGQNVIKRPECRFRPARDAVSAIKIVIEETQQLCNSVSSSCIFLRLLISLKKEFYSAVFFVSLALAKMGFFKIIPAFSSSNS
jgi:hypothetical protein